MRPAPPLVDRFAVTLPLTDVLPGTSAQGPGPLVAVSPDGRTLIYAASRNGVEQLYRRPLDQLEAVAIPGTEGARHPFFSPDGQWLGFLADMKLKKIAMAGGPPITICDVPNSFLGASWGPGDRIVFSGNVPFVLFLVPAAGGVPQPLTMLEPEEVNHRLPHFLPNGNAVIFTSTASTGSTRRLVALTLKTGERRVLLDGTTPRYTSTGHLLFHRDGSVWAVPFDAERLTVTAEPIPVVEGVTVRGGGEAEFDVSQTGALVYLPGSGVDSPERTLVWVDRQGPEEPVKAPTRAYLYPRISPDGTQLAVEIRDQENDVWVWNFARATRG